MKTLFSHIPSFFTLVLLLTCTTLLTACNQEEGITEPLDDTPTEAQAAQIVEAALVSDGQGLDAATAEMIDLAKAAPTTTECGNQIDSTFIFNRNTDRLTANYEVALQWTPSCGPGGLVRSLTFGRSSSGAYQTQRMSSEDSSKGNFTVDNLTGGTSLVVNGSYSRTGSQQMLTRGGRSFNSQIDLTIESLSINKGTKRIESGQSDFTLTGTSAQGRSFAVDGTIVFRGAGSATIIINGNQYEVNR
ncbi:MAG: hypothetical protein AAGA62_05620 [Bacteroidota bacterium]